MPRTTTEHLRVALRRLISDELGADSDLSEDDLERCLDRSARLEVLPLAPWTPIPTQGGARIWRAPVGPWEANVQILDTSGQPVAASSIDLWAGVVTLPDPYHGRLYIAGTAYDFDGAAAEAFRMVASRWMRRYDVSIDGHNLQRGSVAERAMQLASEYQRRARPITATQVRTDVEWGQVC